MNKKTLAIIIAGTALAAGGGFYLYRRSKAQQVVDQYSTTGQNTGIVAQGQNIVDTGKSIISTVSSILKPQGSTSASSYEGKMYRENKGPVYVVSNGLKHYVSKLPTPDGRWNWGMQEEVKSLPMAEGETYDQMMAKYIDPMQPWIGLKGLGRLKGLGETMTPMVQLDGSVVWISQRPSLGKLPTLLTLN